MAANSHQQRAPIRRNRTGCFTCRRRKKKCDELKPHCYNCQRNSILCDGYPVAISYGQHQSHSPRPNASQGLQHDGSIQPTGYAFGPEEGGTDLFDRDLGFLLEGDNELLRRSMGVHETNQPVRTEEFGPPFNQLIEADHPIFTPVLQVEAPMISRGSSRPMTWSPIVPRQIPRNGSLNDLPFLLDNINTSTERQLFSHFTNMTSRILTLSSGRYNPLTSIIVPIASKDQMVMHSLLCLAGSHLASISAEGSIQSVNLEKHRLHDLATRRHSLRVQVLEQRGDPQSPQELESVLASALLLCLYEICEGSGDATWSIHLDTARKLISWAESKPKSGEAENTSSIRVAPQFRPEINRFFLEFFIYHDTLAIVTVASCSSLVSRSRSLRQESNIVQDAYVVGVNDGLCDLISRIADLRSQAVTASPQQNGDILCEAAVIWDDLANWHPKSTDSDQRLIGSLYQWALFIWLYCIVHPDGVADIKLQTGVKRAIEDLEKIQTASGIFSCLLFPLFIIGTASIEENDGEVVKSRFQSLAAWSGLGNVKIAQRIVQNSWENFDEAVPRSWDWIAQMERHGISVPIT
ncbi:hypothetical protein V502_00036 [Pseudogymnoascus sp. VKM F-4520 (FW-2644)]|nr:hypothetical protein V502_00036 [Pseudogymnoascus sp. VKM F-4520 (FW-2644)]